MDYSNISNYTVHKLFVLIFVETEVKPPSVRLRVTIFLKRVEVNMSQGRGA